LTQWQVGRAAYSLRETRRLDFSFNKMKGKTHWVMMAKDKIRPADGTRKPAGKKRSRRSFKFGCDPNVSFGVSFFTALLRA
jgi:hypothetical protein